MCFGLRNNGSQMHQEKAQSLTLMGGEQMMRAVSSFIIVTLCDCAAFFCCHPAHSVESCTNLPDFELYYFQRLIITEQEIFLHV
jgi:hypothetical protein